MEEVESKKSGDTVQLVLKTAVRTFLSAFVCLALTAALAVTFFPYQAMKTYYELGMSSRALECAENYISRHDKDFGEGNPPPVDGRYVSALYLSCELSVSLFTAAGEGEEALFYAEKVSENVEKYLAVPNIHERNAKLEAYYVANQPYAFHVSLYSYSGYLSRFYYRANCLLDKRDKLFAGGKLSSVPLVTSTLLNESLGLNSNNIDSFAEVFNQLSEMINFEFDRAGLVGVGKMTEAELGKVNLGGGEWFQPMVARDKDTGNYNSTLLLRSLENKFDQIKQFAQNMPAASSEEALKQLYIVRSLAYIAENIDDMLTILSGNVQDPASKRISIDDAMRWRALNRVTVNGKQYSLSDYYERVLLPNYAVILSGK